MGESFEEILGPLIAPLKDVYGVLTLVAMVVCFGALVVGIWKGVFGGVADTMRAILSIGVLSVAIQSYPSWIDDLQIMGYKVIEVLEANPSESHQAYARLIAEGAKEDEDTGFWAVLFDEDGGIGKAILYAAILLVGRIAWFVVWLAYLIQQFVLLLGIAVGPLMLSMWLIGTTRGVATRYLLGMIALTAIPVGWAVADLVTKGLLQLIRVGKFADNPISEVLEVDARFKFVLNPDMIHNGRIPSVVVDFDYETSLGDER